MILVTGGTGFVGSSLAVELLKKSYKVRVLSRHPERAASLIEAGCQAAMGDVGDISSVLNAITPGIEAVVHLVGVLAPPRGSSFRAVHVEGTRNVVEACKGMGVARLLHMSALGARPGSASEYHRTKWEAEEIVRSSGLEYTIFRPSVIFGAGDRFTNPFARVIRLFPVVFIPGDGLSRMQPVFVEDVASAFSMSLRQRDTIGKTLELAGPEALTFDEIIDAIGAAMGKRPVKAHMPMPIVNLAAFFAEVLFSKPPFSRESLKMLSEDNTASINALSEVFGMRPTSLSEGLKTYLH